MDFQTLNLQPIATGNPLPPNTPPATLAGIHPVVLLILDGWGIGPHNAGNAIARAKTPNLTQYWHDYPHTQLQASGQAVGLPQGEDGNTETGHLNLGAGRIVYQDLPRINMSIADGTFASNQAFHEAFEHVRRHQSTLHLMGLVGSGGVHSNLEHLLALLTLAQRENITSVYIHAFTDGRDSPPTAGITYIQQLVKTCEQLGVGKIATLMGRYFAMDRDHRWERVEKAYNALTLGGSACATDPLAAMQTQYDEGITDEFLEPINICDHDGSQRVIQDNDAVIFFNYRIDRPRELTRAFVLPDFETGRHSESFDPYAVKYERTHLAHPTGGEQAVGSAPFHRQRILHNLYFVTMTEYEKDLPVAVAFPPTTVQSTLGEVLSQNRVRQVRMAETEKERFVTFYFSGQNEGIFPGEERVILPSKGTKSYDQTPEMSAREITAHLTHRIDQDSADVIICNLANADMVAHTGNLPASIQACEVVDECVGMIVKTVLAKNGVVLITADHGNAEELINNATGEVDTEHSTYPVPFIVVGKQYLDTPKMLPPGILGDVAPTLLAILGIPKPEAMTGRPLLQVATQLQELQEGRF